MDFYTLSNLTLPTKYFLVQCEIQFFSTFGYLKLRKIIHVVGVSVLRRYSNIKFALLTAYGMSSGNS